MRILWLKTELLHPVDKGGKIRTYNMLRELKREHEITYLTLDDGTAPDDAAAQAGEYCHEIIRVPHSTRPKFSLGFYAELGTNLLSTLPYFMRKYQSPAMKSEIERQLSRGRFDLLVCDFLQPSVNLPNKLPVPSVLFQHNVEAMIWKRHYQTQTNPLKKAYLYFQWRKAWRYEGSACLKFDVVIAVSKADEDRMRHDYGLNSTANVPTGVDVDYFQSRAEAIPQKHALVFTGSMDWLPNQDAMQYFITDILPLVRSVVPDVSLTIVGRNPYDSLVALAARDKNILVTGRVDDVRPYIEKAQAYIVPIRIGGGTRLKIYEAMAMSKPVISTTVGSEGLPLRHGKEILLADTAEDFAAAVVRVITEDEVARQLGTEASKLVRHEFAWRGVANSFEEICERTTQPRIAAA